MKRPQSDDPDINKYIDHLISENDDLKVELMTRKSKRSLEHEYKELISDILSATIETYNKHKDDEENQEITSFTFLVKTYIKTFSDDYKIHF